ncbi:MAG: hypothetical protein ACHQTE_00590 [Candidatus Saccharimonadales bacterium]
MEKTPIEPDEFAVADAMIEAATQQTKEQQASNQITDAFQRFQKGEISGGEYAQISHPQSYIENTARDAAQTATERINNSGQPLTPAQRLARFVFKRK